MSNGYFNFRENVTVESGRIKFKRHARVLILVSQIFRRMPRLAAFLLSRSQAAGNIGIALRYCALRALAAECGSNVLVEPFVCLKNVHNLRIGDNVSLHSFCYIDAVGEINIGNNVAIAHGCSILSTDHTWDDISVPIKYNELRPARTVIEDDVWLGCGVRVLSGTRIERRSVVAAGAVTKGTLEGGALYGGVPSKFIRRLADGRQRF